MSDGGMPRMAAIALCLVCIPRGERYQVIAKAVHRCVAAGGRGLRRGVDALTRQRLTPGRWAWPLR